MVFVIKILPQLTFGLKSDYGKNMGDCLHKLRIKNEELRIIGAVLLFGVFII
jgi:hypothetical protein